MGKKYMALDAYVTADSAISESDIGVIVSKMTVEEEKYSAAKAIYARIGDAAKPITKTDTAATIVPGKLDTSKYAAIDAEGYRQTTSEESTTSTENTETQQPAVDENTDEVPNDGE